MASARRRVKRTPTKYTPEIVKTLVDALRLGETYGGAAAAAGISNETLRVWRDKRPEFAAAIARAESELRRVCLARIEKAAAAGTWRASLAILERRFPHDFGRHANIEVTGRNGGPIQLDAKTWRDYPWLASDGARDAAATLIEALAAHAELIAREAHGEASVHDASSL